MPDDIKSDVMVRMADHPEAFLRLPKAFVDDLVDEYTTKVSAGLTGLDQALYEDPTAPATRKKWEQLHSDAKTLFFLRGKKKSQARY